MTDKDYMLIAIAEAKRAEAAGDPPISSIMVKGGKVIAKGWSSVGKDLDPSGHNDINCIRAACKTLNMLNLAGCTMYTTIEPCAMSLVCAGWTGLTRIVFGAYKEDIAGNPYLLKDYHAERLARSMQLFNGKKLEVIGGVLRAKCKQLMERYQNWQPPRPYLR